jgi:hypothetical protein
LTRAAKGTRISIALFFFRIARISATLDMPINS